MSMQGLLFQGHYWYYCSGCGHPTIGRCCGQLEPWRNDVHGLLPNAIQRARSYGHQFGYVPGYGGYNTYDSFLGTLGTIETIEGIADGDPLQVMEGMALQDGNVGGAMLFGLLDDRNDGFGDGFDLF